MTNNQILNLISDDTSFSRFAPQMETAAIDANRMSSTTFAATYNELFSNLVKRIAKVNVQVERIENKLTPIYKQIEMPFAQIAETINFDVTKGENFVFDNTPTPTTVDPYIIQNNAVKVQFHDDPIRKVYPQTIQHDRMRNAFLNENGLSEVINGLVMSVKNGISIDEEEVIRRVIRTVIDRNKDYKIVMQGNGNPLDDSLTPVQARYWLKNIEMILEDVQYTRRKYNNMQVIRQVNKSDLLFVVRQSAWDNIIKTGLPELYHDNYYKIDDIQIVKIDSWAGTEQSINFNAQGKNTSTVAVSDDTSKLVGMIIEKDTFFRCNNGVDLTNEIFNPRGLYVNYFTHIWYSMHANFAKTLIGIYHE